MAKSKPSPHRSEDPDTPWWLRLFMRQKLKWRIILLIVALPLGVIYLVVTYYPQTMTKVIEQGRTALTSAPTRETSLKVAVFLPSPEGDSSASKDAVAQLEGFNKAFDAFNAGVPEQDRHMFFYDFDRKPVEDFAAHILTKMKEYYTEKDVRVFVITMSSAAVRLKESFKTWRNSIDNVAERPVLICTVASAPGIADIESGILRHYVRSEEEATGLAHYGRWALKLQSAAVLFVTKDMGHQNDPYGEKSRQLFSDEFTLMGGKIVGAFEVDPRGVHALEQVKRAVHKLPSDASGVFLAGYGTMFRETLAALAEVDFKGTVLCTSTISEDDWRPPGIEKLTIVSIEPRRKRGSENAPTFERKIVRFMAYETLIKALDCGRWAHSTPDFIRNWQRGGDGTTDADLQLEYMANGDTQIRLKPVRFPDGD